MTKTFTKIAIVSALAIFALVAISAVVVSYTPSAQAAGSCGSCGGGGSTGGNGEGGDHDPVPVTPTCKITVNKSVVKYGETYTVSWVGTPSNALFYINGQRVAAVDSANYTFDSANYERFVMKGDNGGPTCQAQVQVDREVPVGKPTCDALTATPQNLPAGGGNVTLTWATTGGNIVSINNGVGTVTEDGSKTVNVTSSKTFTLTVQNGAGSDTCTVPVTVATPTPAPKCDSFTASPSALPAGGGNVTLTWATSNSNNVKLDGAAVAADGSKTVNVTANKTYTLTVIGTAGEQSDSCTASVTVAQPNVLSCANNVTFTASDYSLPKSGGDVTLTWSTTGLDSVTITSVTNPNLSGSATINVTSDKTFTLTGTKNGTSIACPLTVDVATGGGGGGGPAAPTCDLDISDTKISRGQEVELEWETSAAKEIILRDNHGNEILNSDDRDDLDSSIKLRPTDDTTFELTAKNGNRKVTCKEKVYVKDGVTVLETRNQPLVKGISLTQVPYTGFEAGPFLTSLFYILLTIWGLFVAYVVAVRRNMIGGFSFAGAHDHVAYTDVSTEADPVDTTETIAEEYVASATAAPANLPTGTAPIFGYAAMNTAAEEDTTAVDESIEMSELENRAHALKTLFSSDAMRYFMNQVPVDGRTEAFDALVHQAKATFPSEDGWVVVNLARLESLMATDNGNESVAAEVAPIAGGSLAEAIVTGNIVAAYQMIANRPMIALADAASELDGVVRARRGEQVNLSNLLARETASLTDGQIAAAINALTGALDGVYTTEEEAVKMAIMKAVKAIV